MPSQTYRVRQPMTDTFLASVLEGTGEGGTHWLPQYAISWLCSGLCRLCAVQARWYRKQGRVDEGNTTHVPDDAMMFVLLLLCIASSPVKDEDVADVSIFKFSSSHDYSYHTDNAHE